MQLRELLDHLVSYQLCSDENPVIRSIETDSREVSEGSLFICISGFTVDGHDFAAQAAASGAVAIVAERLVQVAVPVVVVSDPKWVASVLADVFYQQPSRKLNLVGVTGTNGKTTTTTLIKRIFGDDGRRTGFIGTIGMDIDGTPIPIESLTSTTPDAITLQKCFSKMVKENVDSAVMEVSSHALDQGRVRGCDFNIAVFTNLTQDHLEYHGSMAEYFHAKSLLFSQLGNTYDKKEMKVAVINQDDSHAAQLKKATAVQAMTYGVTSESDVRATDVRLMAEGSVFSLNTPFGTTVVHMKLIGLFNVYNALAAAAVGLLSGISLENVKQSLEAVHGIPGRFEKVNAGQPFTVIVDYAHTPDGLENVLRSVKEMAQKRIFVVAGCGGDRDRTKRALMAQIAVKYGDVVVFTSDNPRGEDPENILRDMEAGVPGASYQSFVNRKEAIHYCVGQASAEDIVVIAGKGHETYQIIGKDVIHFDDREVARKAIEQRSRKDEMEQK